MADGSMIVLTITTGKLDMPAINELATELMFQVDDRLEKERDWQNAGCHVFMRVDTPDS